MTKYFTVCLSLIFLLGCTGDKEFLILDDRILSAYVESFNQKDDELYVQYVPNDSALLFLSKNIPRIEVPDKEIEETYYFRWWTFRKHIKHTKDGFVITEFLPKVSWSGKYNTINCPAGHHIYEGRWLRNPKYIADYINFWLAKSGNGIRQYGFWIADASLAFYQVHRNDQTLSNQLPLLVNNYEEWERTNRDAANVLFWQEDNREGMEFTVSGRMLNNGSHIFSKAATRPSMNSYMYGDAKAISILAKLTNNASTASTFKQKALSIKQEVESRLWNKKLGFFSVLPKNYSDTTSPLNVRELIGYIPWYFNLPEDLPEYSKAWDKTIDTTGFYAPYGLTVCERSHPFFEVSYTGHECQWNGPSWPYATTQTLKGLSNFLNNYTNTGSISNENYYHLFLQYAKSHSIINEQGEKQKWIDENLNPFTGDWLSMTRLKTWENGTWSEKKGGKERGKDYNHSGFCDLVISDLLGFKSQIDNTLKISPLLPEHWDWFCLDGVYYKGKNITVLYDKDGTKYRQGKGLTVFVNGELIAQKKTLQPIHVKL